MSIQHANRGIVKKDLQLYYNREFSKSFRGESSTNLITNTVASTGGWDGNLFNNWINATVALNVDIAPDGTMTAVRLTGGYSRWTNSITVDASTTYYRKIFTIIIKIGSVPSKAPSIITSIRSNCSISGNSKIIIIKYVCPTCQPRNSKERFTVIL